MNQLKMKRVLYIEDDQDSCEILSLLLLREGYTVFITDSAEGALQLVTAETFDLLVMDEVLPDGSGCELTRIIRNLGIKTPIVFYSAHAYPEDAAKAVAAGAQDYLTKPSDFVELVKVVKKLLEPDSTAIKKPPGARRRTEKSKKILSMGR